MKFKGLLFDKDGTLFDFQKTWNTWSAQMIEYFSVGDAGRRNAIADAVGFDLTRQAFDPDSIVIAGTNRQAGCTVQGENVHMGRDFVMEMVAKAPSQWTLTPRNPDRELIIGGPYMLFGAVSLPPSYWDIKTGTKVPGTRETCTNLIKLSQYFNCIHFVGGYPVEPVDLHASTRHLNVLYDKLTISDKVPHAYSLGKERVVRFCSKSNAILNLRLMPPPKTTLRLMP